MCRPHVSNSIVWRDLDAEPVCLSMPKSCLPTSDTRLARRYNVDAMSAEVYRFGWKGHPEWEIRGECVKDAEGHYNAKVRDTTGTLQ